MQPKITITLMSITIAGLAVVVMGRLGIAGQALGEHTVFRCIYSDE